MDKIKGVNRGSQKKMISKSEEISFLGIEKYKIKVEPSTIANIDGVSSIVYLISHGEEPSKEEYAKLEKLYKLAQSKQAKFYLIINKIDLEQNQDNAQKFKEKMQESLKLRGITTCIYSLSTIDESNEDNLYSNISYVFQNNLKFNTEIRSALEMLKKASSIVGAMLFNISTFMCVCETPSDLYKDFNCAIRNSLELVLQLHAKDSTELKSHFEYKFSLTMQSSKYNCDHEICSLCTNDAEDKMIVYIVKAGDENLYSKELLIVFIKEAHMQLIETIKYNIKKTVAILEKVTHYMSERIRKEKELSQM